MDSMKSEKRRIRGLRAQMLNEFYFDRIYIRHAIDDAPEDREFNMHIHEQCEVYFFVSGNVDYLVEGTRYELPENSLILMRPMEAHKASILSGERYERYALNFPVDWFSEIDPEGKLTEAFLARPVGMNNLYTTEDLDTERIRKLFSEMCEADNEYDRKLAIHTHLGILLDLLRRAYRNKQGTAAKEPTLAEKMVAFVNHHITDAVSIPELSKHFFLSESQFSRLFKRATGSSPWEFIVRKRLSLVREKVKSGLTIRKASEECGFSDYSAFYRAYKKYMGECPREDLR